MLLEPLLRVETLADLGDPSNPNDAAHIGYMIDKAVEVERSNVVFHLKKPFPTTTFFQILSQTWSSIIDKECAIKHGAWPCNKDNWVNVFAKYHNPEVPELQEADCGSGPFMLEKWEHGKEVSLVRFNDYWRGPAKIERVIIKKADEWSTRKLMFLQGDVDMTYIPRQYVKELEGAEGIRYVTNLPEMVIDVLFFTFETDPNNPYIGSGKLDGKGIPSDFFSDINVRKAFVYAFDWKTYIEQAWMVRLSTYPAQYQKDYHSITLTSRNMSSILLSPRNTLRKLGMVRSGRKGSTLRYYTTSETFHEKLLPRS